jgi:hypothetical protein
LSLAKVEPEIMEEARTDATGELDRTTLEALAKVPKEDEKALAKNAERGVVREGGGSRDAAIEAVQPTQTGQAGAGRNAAVRRRKRHGRVMFRKREATNEKVAEVLSRAAV